MRLPAVVVLDPGTILKFDKIPSMLLAGMNIKRTTKQKWLIGCLSAAGVLVVLSGLAILAFFKVMDILKKVPPESTQIVLYNDTANSSCSCEGVAAKFHRVATTNCRILRAIRPYTWR